MGLTGGISIGAIQASAGDNTKALVAALAELPKLSEYLDREQRDNFFQLLDHAIMHKPLVTSSEKRPIKRKIIDKLQEYNIDNARNIADLLVDIGIYDRIDLHLSLLEHPQVDWILDLAYNLASLMGSNQTIMTSVEKASKVVFALKNYARFDYSGEKQLVEITEGLETILEIYYNRLKHNIEILRNYQNIPKIWCYPDELIQVWTNLEKQLKRSLGQNYNIELASSGRDALALCTELTAEGVDLALVISDRTMPGMSGDEFLIKLHAAYPKTLKILLTGQADVDSVVNIVNAGALYRYIAKPWDETDFILTVKEALRRYEQEEQ